MESVRQVRDTRMERKSGRFVPGLLRDPMQEMALFFETLALLLRSGMLVSEAVRHAAKDCGPELQQIAAAVSEPLSEGIPLHRALEPWKRRLPPIVRPVLEVGAVSGTLESSAARLGGTFRKAADIDRRYRKTVFDLPFVLLVLLFECILMVFANNIWQFLFTLGISLLGTTALYLAGRLLFRLAGRWGWLHVSVDTIKLALPLAHIVARNLAAARWARSLATCWHAGVPISEALEVCSRSALNAHYERALQHTAACTRMGWSLHASLAQTRLLPAYLLDILETGEMSGRLGTCLDRFVGLLEEEALERGRQFATVVVATTTLVAMLVTLWLAITQHHLPPWTDPSTW